MATNFAYLLNAMERAAGEHNPAEHDYRAKRTAVLAHVADLEAERDRLTACLNAANEQAEHFERQWYLMTDERDQLQDKLADAEGSMLRRFDPAAAESTDLFTWITCMLAERNRLKNLVAMAELAIGEHYAPSDCYSTGPLTWGIADHLCPACAFIAVLAAKGE